VDHPGPERHEPPSGAARGADEPRHAYGPPGGNERWLYSVFEHSQEIVTVVDPDGTLRYASPALGRVLGHDLEELVGTNVLGYVHPDDLPRVLEEAEKVIAEGKTTSTRVECRFRHADGSWRWVESVGTRLLDGPAAGGVVVNSTDVTERKEGEERLRAAEERYRALVETAPVVTYVKEIRDGASATIYVSPQVKDVVGYTPEECTSTPDLWAKILHPEDKERVLAEDERTNETGEPFVMEYRQVARDGSVVWLCDEATLVRGDDGEPLYWLGVQMDISERKRAENRLAEAEERYRTLVEQIPAVTYIDRATDGPDEPLYVSPQIEGMLGYTPEEWLGQKLWPERLHPEDRERVLAADERFESGEDTHFGEEYRLFAKDGSVLWVREEAVAVRAQGGEPLLWQGLIFDINERKVAEERLRTLANAAFEGIVITHRGEILEVNEAYLKMLGYERSELIGKSVLEIVAPGHRKRVWHNILTGHEGPYEVVALKKDGTSIDVEVRGRAFAYGGRTVRVTAVRDVTERKAFERRLEYQAFRDPLTGLPNRALFMDRLGHALARAKRGEDEVAILFMDLDDFKVVNDSLGHEAGDRLLIEVSGRLGACLRSQDTLARFGGDEFAVVLEGITNPRDVASVAERIAAEFRKPFEVAGRQVFVSTSIGVSLGAAGRTGPEEMVRDADTAMYRAKGRGGADYRVFEPRMHAEAMRRLEQEGDLRRAIQEDEFELYYQPNVLLRTGEITGVEALLRWEHPERGLETPAEFVYLAEETGLIAPLGRWVLGEACRRAREWQTLYPGDPPLEVNVNLSARQFRDPGLAKEIRNVLAETGLDPPSLFLEITESALMEDVLSTLGTLRWLKDLGVRLAVDDFGTGYSSLAYLKRFPIDAIKIDRSITSGVDRDPADAAVALATITLAHALGLEVVAEGIERPEELVELQRLGCDLGQGHYFAEPLPKDALGTLLKKRFLP
jgi:diguanylate cyclase (GGDEF)-like protein/PAS domain S-box-containing protein